MQVKLIERHVRIYKRLDTSLFHVMQSLLLNIYNILYTVYQNDMCDNTISFKKTCNIMFNCFVHDHEISIHRAHIAGNNEKTVDEGLLVMDHSRRTYANL